MSHTSVHQLEVNKLIGKIMRLTQACLSLPVATKDDKLYMVYCDAPWMSPEDKDEGMWFTVDSKITATFGIDVIKHNLMRGSLGIELALKYFSMARDHNTWTSNSESLLKEKLEMIVRELIKAGASDQLDEVPIKAGQDKKEVVSRPDVDPDACHSQPKKPAAKRAQLDTLESNGVLIIVSSDDEVTKPHKNTSEIVSAPKKPLRVSSKIEEVNLVSIIISSDDEVTQPHKHTSKIVPIPKKAPGSSSKVNKAQKALKILDKCPLSTSDTPCNQCKIEVTATSADKEFRCHCGQKMIILRAGRTEKALNHWETKACKQKTSTLRSNAVLIGFVGKSPGDNQQVKSGLVEVECPGLTDSTWYRPRATCTIKSFLEHTCSIYRGNN
ncbi:hypothetical protein DFH28DRAFT_1114281 [Melampsora americana]|nr:hypothetical protein DFH28DRAFT_1114281 [Melampsora americana]